MLILFVSLQVIFDMVHSSENINSCAGCFAQNWNWVSWQCDVNCNVQTSKYGEFCVVPCEIHTNRSPILYYHLLCINFHWNQWKISEGKNYIDGSTCCRYMLLFLSIENNRNNNAINLLVLVNPPVLKSIKSFINIFTLNCVLTWVKGDVTLMTDLKWYEDQQWGITKFG